MRYVSSARLLLFAVVLLALAAPGCIFSPDSGDDPPVVNDNFVFASSVTLLMQNFEEAYNKLNASEYRDMLDTRFQFYYLDGTDHDYTTEVRIAENMFSGRPPTNPDPGSTNSGIRSVDVQTLDLIEAWEPISASHPDFGGIPDAMRGVYQVRLVFNHDGGTITVSSNQFFYAVPVPVVVNGQALVEWKLLGQEDIAG